MMPLLVEMALKMSTINVSGQRRIHVVKSMLNTNIISGLMFGLVLWLLVW
jgi:hypothetical protein